MVQVELSKIIIDEKRQDQVIVLKEKNGGRQFPIIIGIVEASSIKLKISGIEPPRPMTHDLVLLSIEGLEAKVDKLVIDKMLNNTFHAKLYLKNKNDEEKVIDCRPSDGISVAVRSNSPIFAEEDVINKAAIIKN